MNYLEALKIAVELNCKLKPVATNFSWEDWSYKWAASTLLIKKWVIERLPPKKKYVRK